MQNRTRIFSIDFLRAVAILGVMVTHSLALFLGPPATNTIWNYLHFVVVAFVFCSGYVTWQAFNRNINILGWYKKRFIRLFFPYLLYVAVVFLWSRAFSPSSLILTGGIDVGWLTLLFLQLALITPVCVWIVRSGSRYIIALSALGLFALVTVIFPISSVYSRAVAWLPWTFIYLLGMGIAKYSDARQLVKTVVPAVIVAAAGTWITLRSVLIMRGTELTLTLHKYPPDLFYFSYGIAICGCTFLFTRMFEKQLQGTLPVVTFYSKHSYGMFFLHLLILNFLIAWVPRAHVIGMIAGSIALTSVGMWFWDRVRLYKERRLNA